MYIAVITDGVDYLSSIHELRIWFFCQLFGVVLMPLSNAFSFLLAKQANPSLKYQDKKVAINIC